jgi:hypothetical protein
VKSFGALLLSPFLLGLGLSAIGCASRSSRAAWLDRPLQCVAAPEPPHAEPIAADRTAAEPLAELLQRVAVVRGLEPGPLPSLVELPADELARRARQQFERDVPEQVRSAQALLLQRLGLVPSNFELASALEASLPGRLEAFYAGEPPTLYSDSALSGTDRQRALAHELVHALQDRAHGLTRRLRYEPGAWDRQSALHALAEADALAVVERLGWGASERPPSEDGPALPGVITRSLAAPYLDARARVSELLAQGGFPAVDRALAQPPASTHELLHPGEGAALPALGEFPAPSPAYQAVYADVLGEQSVRGVLEEWASAEEAAELASGWAGDRVSVFASDTDVAIVWELALQRPDPAGAIARLLASAHRPVSPARSRTAVAEWNCGTDGDGAVVGVLRQGDRVRFGSFRFATPGGCSALGAWLRGTWVRSASPVARHPAKQPSEKGSGHRKDQFRQPSPVENFVR